MEKTEKDSKEKTEFKSYFKEKLGNYFKEYDWEIEKFNNNNRAIYFLENKKNIDDVIFIKQIKLFYEENILKEIKEILKETDINSDEKIEKENSINKDIIKEIKKIYKEKIDQEIQKGNKNINEVIQKEKNIDQVILKIIKEKKIKEMNQNTLKEIYFLVLLRQSKEYYFSKLNEIKIFDDKKYVFLIFRENKISLDMLMETINCQIFENEKSIQNIIFYICLELVYLHFNNIIHNDLKPSNILISNESLLVPLCDFGAMRYEEEISNEYTKYYVAPEFFYNNDKRNNKSDMWSLGIIMIEIFYTKNISEKLSELDKNKLLSNLDKEEKEKELLLKLEKKAKKELFSKIGIREKYDSSKEEIEKNINFEKIKNIVKNEKAFHLIEKLVVLDPDKRYNAEEALKSDYLIDLYKIIQFEIDILTKLNTYDKINKLKDEKEVFEIIKELDSKLKEFK
jgi:serine/threonine protein kinase